MKERIKAIAKEIGFDLIGFSESKSVENDFINFYLKYLKNKYNGELYYLEKNLEKRFKPKRILPSVKTIITLGINYYSEIPDNSIFPRYLTKIDYHIVIKKMLKTFIENLKKELGDFEYRVFVDSGPILEKYWAKKSGIGFIGKNSLIINKEFGSFIFLSEVFIDKEIEPDREIENLCGECRRCIESCPTGAILENGIIDARKCLSYLTIEKKELSEYEKGLIKKGNKIFGCEICQEVCSFNRNLKETEKEELRIPEILKNLKIHNLKDINFEIFKSTVIERKLKKLDKKNLYDKLFK
ncbi:MAG: tRNA epoxyqueuosine(34) reductase QueG [Candidatus Omnitrophica bacterium]|nr:tRNA epoxyqueuosine(34) reductase QueG [Candidatus Omnitrophota bacterium]MCM8803393.1 tRNA epoxyqueuosine(34) reductase QueG [Candidatus Omnitrophota bacterium]